MTTGWMLWNGLLLLCFAPTSPCLSHGAVFLLAGPVQAETAPLTTLFSADNTYVVRYRTEPNPIPLNAEFNLHIWVSADEAGGPVAGEFSLAVDARMPQHRHGMNRRPKLTAMGKGEFLAEGLLFHMPGKWELYLDITADGLTERAQCVIQLD